jgi:hypothetical protein
VREDAMAGETRWTLDGEPVDFAELELDLSDEERRHAETLAPGESMLLGGGAAAEFTLRREA